MKDSLFSIENLKICTDYHNQQPNEKHGISDSLIIGIDFYPNLKNGCLIVAKREKDKIYILNEFRNDKALELYYKLIGK